MDLRDTRRVIHELERYLRTLHKLGMDIPLVTPDGIYGEGDRDAVRKFQTSMKLPSSGVVDYDTWTAIVKIIRSNAREQIAPQC